MSVGRTEFIKRCFIAVAIALIPVLVWYLFDLVLICISALLVSALLGLGAEPLVRWLRFPRHVALAISALVILGGLGAAIYLFGSRVATDLQDVIARAQSGQSTIVSSIEGSEVGRTALEHARSQLDVVSWLPRVFGAGIGFIGGAVVALIAGIFFAAQPKLYLSGLVHLFPPRLHREVDETIDAIGRSLRLWLLGQLIEMLVIGVLTTVAVWLIGLPSPFALGLIAGLAEFIPYVGPIISAVPAVLVAATQDLHAVLWTLVAYTLIHQAEGHVIMPFIQRYMVVIPPAMILLSIVAFGSLFGIVAVPLASPLAVVAFVVITKLYVRDTLGENAPLPG
jgi:predicted PurR-regulated permease PerM